MAARLEGPSLPEGRLSSREVGEAAGVTGAKNGLKLNGCGEMPGNSAGGDLVSLVL
jgi:hypothetical protein